MDDNETAVKNKVTNAVQEEKFSVQDLKNNCEALGYKREIVAGAFLDCKEIEMTKTQFKETIIQFMKKKVE